ncbi:MAG: peptidylprolyl isomerase [Gallionella sp.]|nr:peptidylprolyl isomerase [Gallionella sp.]
MKLFRILLVGAVSTMSLCACNPSGTSNAASKGAIVATVNGTAISENRVKMMMKTTQQPDTPELRKDIIEHLTMQLILSQEATKKGLDKSPDVSDQLDLNRQSLLAKAFIQDHIKNSTISDDMLNAEYKKISGQMAGNEYKARHILVEKEADAKGIITKLKKNPKTFASLAKEKSLDPGSKANGGDLGWFDSSAMVPEFSAAVSKLEKGKFTEEPVKTQFGYHVIMLDDTRPITTPPLDQIKSTLQQQIQQQNLEKLLEDLKAKAKIELAQAAAPAASPAKDAKHAEPGK